MQPPNSLLGVVMLLRLEYCYPARAWKALMTEKVRAQIEVSVFLKEGQAALEYSEMLGVTVPHPCARVIAIEVSMSRMEQQSLQLPEEPQSTALEMHPKAEALKATPMALQQQEPWCSQDGLWTKLFQRRPLS